MIFPLLIVLLFSVSLFLSHLFLSHPPLPAQFCGGGGGGVLFAWSCEVLYLNVNGLRAEISRLINYVRNRYRKSLSGLLCLDYCKSPSQKVVAKFFNFCSPALRYGCKILAEKWLQSFAIFEVLHYDMVAKAWQKNVWKVLPFLQYCITLWFQNPGRKMIAKFCHFCNPALSYSCKPRHKNWLQNFAIFTILHYDTS